MAVGIFLDSQLSNSRVNTIFVFSCLENYFFDNRTFVLHFVAGCVIIFRIETIHTICPPAERR